MLFVFRSAQHCGKVALNVRAECSKSSVFTMGEKMLKDNLKTKMKQWDILRLMLELVTGGAITCFSAIFCMWLCQLSCGVSLTEINAKSAFVIYVSIYAIIFALSTIVGGRFALGNCTAMVFLFVVSMLDYQVYYFRGTEILPGDIDSMRTALGVVGQYHFQITINLVISVLILILYLMVCK